MMIVKKILGLSLLMLFVTICSAQSLKFMDDTGNDIGGTVHYEYGSLWVLSQTIFQMENLTANNITLKVRAEKVYIPNLSSGLEVVVNSGGNTASGNIIGPQIINFDYNIAGNTLISWFKIATVTWPWAAGAGNDSAIWNITIYDEQNVNDSVAATIIWKQVSDPVSVEENVALNKFNIFPNPVIGDSFAISNLSEVSESVVLYDVAGREVRKFSLEGHESSLRFDIAELDAGIYYCTVKDAGGIQKTQKLIIN